MNSIKTASFLGNLRPSSRSASPAAAQLSTPEPPTAEMAANPLTLATSRGRVKTLSSLAPFRRNLSPAPQAPVVPAPTLVQDGTYLQVLGLKLSEAASKCLAQPTGPLAVGEATFDGKRPLPPGRGKAIGSLIVSELHATEANTHLHRAILRLLHRPLSVLLTSLNICLLPLVTSPAFVAPTPLVLASPPPSAQVIALSVAALAAELLDSFDAVGLGLNGDGPGALQGGLKGVREGLESVITRVVGPLVAQVKHELGSSLDGMEHAPPAPSPPLPKAAGVARTGSSPHMAHPSILSLTHAAPAHARALARYTTPPCAQSQVILASCLIALVWRAMLSLGRRSFLPYPRSMFPPSVIVPPPSPPSVQQNGTSKKRFGYVTPPATPSASRFLMKLPSSRPPSPPSTSSTPVMDSIVSEARCVYDLLNGLPKPCERAHSLAREAVLEAFSAFCALVDLFAIVCAAAPWDADAVPVEVPTLVALPVLLRALGGPALREASVPSMLGFDDREFRESCLGGFGPANECGPPVAKRLLEAFVAAEDPPTSEQVVLMRWLETRSTA